MKSGSQAGKMLKHSTIYAIGNISRQLVSFLMLPIYTRYLTPADYGVVGLISFAIAMFETLFGAKMVQALPKFYHEQTDENARNRVISTAFIITGLVSSLTVSFIFLLRQPMSQMIFDTTQFALIVGLCGFQMLTQALEYYALMYLRLIDRPMTFVGINITKLVVQLTLNIVLVVHLEMGVLGVAISGLAASSIFSAILSVWTLAKVGLRFDTKIGLQMVIFSWPLWLSGLAALYLYSSSRYYIRIFDSLTNVGLYELAAKFSGILSLLIWTPFSQYWQTEQFKIVQRPDAEKVLAGVFRFISCFLIITGLGISIFADPVIRILSTPAFLGAAHAVPFLLGVSILASLTELGSVSLLSKGKTKWLSLNTYITAAFVTLLYCMLTPLLGYVGAAAALAAAQTLQFVVVQRKSRAMGGFHVPFKPVIYMGAIATTAYVLSNRILNQEWIIADLAVKCVIYLIATLVLLRVLWTDPVSKDRLISLYHSLRNKRAPQET